MREILDKVSTLEEAFEKLFLWSRYSSQSALYLREWRNLSLSTLKSEAIPWKDAMENLYARASTLQDMIYEAHKHYQLFAEVLENAVQDQPLFI